ncbi:hypothetical protein Tco_0934229 [Tanacetum coccineum]
MKRMSKRQRELPTSTRRRSKRHIQEVVSAADNGEFVDTIDGLFRMLQNHTLRRETRREVYYQTTCLLLERMRRKSNLRVGNRLAYGLSMDSPYPIHTTLSYKEHMTRSLVLGQHVCCFHASSWIQAWGNLAWVPEPVLKHVVPFSFHLEVFDENLVDIDDEEVYVPLESQELEVIPIRERPKRFESQLTLSVLAKGHMAIPCDFVRTHSVQRYNKGNGPLKDDKRKVTGIKILDDLEQRIERVEKILNKEKEKMNLKKGKGKMVMERGKTSFEQIA